MQKIGGELGRPVFLFFLVEVYLTSRQIDQALEAINQVIEAAENCQERLNESDLHRLKGSSWIGRLQELRRS